jgi:conjugal transfer ATP-binding protein TraC
MNERAQYSNVSKDFLNFHSLGDLLPYGSYDETFEIFINERSYGFILEVGVFTGFSEELERELGGLFQSILPEGSSIQFLLVASSKIGNILDTWENARSAVPHFKLLQSITKQRKEFFANKALTGEGVFRLRNFRLIISCGLPGASPSRLDLQKCKELKSQVETVFTAAGVGAKTMDPTDLIRLLDELLNCDISIKNSEKEWNKYQSIRSQIIDFNTVRTLSDKALIQNLDEWEYRTYNVKKYPHSWYLGGMSNLIGENLRDLLQIPCQFAIAYGISIEKSKFRKTALLAKGARVESQAASILGKWIPSLTREAQEFQFIREQFEQNDRLVKTCYQVLLIDTPDAINASEQLLMMLYRSNGWELAGNRFIILSSLLGMLPLAWSDGMSEDMSFFKQTKTTLSFEPVNLLPIQAEFKGTKTPGMLLAARRGQVFYWYPFDNQGGNSNVCVVGRPGSGKSVFMQELVTDILGLGGSVYVLDVGRSFEKQVNFLGGQFIEFSPHSGLCINPFSTINDASDEDIADSLALLKPIISLMVAPKGGTRDNEDAIIERGLYGIWKQNGRNTCINDLVEWLLAEDDNTSQNLGKMLFPYSINGAYGRFFNGKATVDFNAEFVVVELEELKSRKDLQAVVVQIFMLLMTNKISLGHRMTTSAIVIDEAWDVLKGKQGGEFAEGMARKIRKLKGCLITGTQSVNDFYATPAAEAVFDNSDWLCMLSQKKEAIELLKKSGRFMVDEYTQKLLSSVKTKQGEYAEIMIMHESGAAVARLILDPFSRILYSSKAEEYSAVKQYQAQGLSLEDSIRKVADSRYSEK